MAKRDDGKKGGDIGDLIGVAALVGIGLLHWRGRRKLKAEQDAMALKFPDKEYEWEEEYWDEEMETDRIRICRKCKSCGNIDTEENTHCPICHAELVFRKGNPVDDM